jgi:hypothetical protein
MSDASNCPDRGYHNADGPELDVVASEVVDGHYNDVSDLPAPPHDDPRWPLKCDHCDYQFIAQDEFQVFVERIYVDDAGREYSLHSPVPGMMWDAFWMPECYRGPDGRCLVVVCPNGREWMIDGQASNCTMKEDFGPFDAAHRCWVRHGEPPLLIVDKAGRTCAAGAGSIQAGDYHGFLGCNGAAPGYFT